MIHPHSSSNWTETAADGATTEPSSVFALKSLFSPLSAVLTLIACLLANGAPLNRPYFLVAVSAFIGAADLLDVPRINPWLNVRVALRRLADIGTRWLIIVGCVWLVVHLCGLGPGLNVHVLREWALVTPAVLWSGEYALQRLLHRNRLARSPRRSVIVGITDQGLRLEQALAGSPLLHTQVVGFIEDRATERLPPHSAAILGSSPQLADLIRQHQITAVYITLPLGRHPRMVQIMEAVRDSTASIYFVPDLLQFEPIQARFERLGGMPLLAVCESPFYGARTIAKRLLDIFAAGTAITLALPLLLLIAIGVRLDSPGPIIFRQKRYGLDGHEITVYKFRSMRIIEDGKTSFTAVSRQDQRVTKFGALIRKTSLDELPQLFNVLEGRMSVVGPRPHPIAMNEHYRQLIPSYMVRHKVKPGITGWAQVNGYRGGDDLESMRKRIEFDLQYLRHWSLWLDLRILFRTAAVIWADRHAY